MPASSEYRTMAIALFVILALAFVTVGCRDMGFMRRVQPAQSSCNAMRATNATSATSAQASKTAVDDGAIGTQPSLQDDFQMAERPSGCAPTSVGDQFANHNTKELKNIANYNNRTVHPMAKHKLETTYSSKMGVTGSTSHILHAKQGKTRDMSVVTLACMPFNVPESFHQAVTEVDDAMQQA